MRIARATYGRVFGLLLLAAVASSSAKAQGAKNPQIPDWIVNEPAGGVDYHKLPDVEGIHLGMPVADAVAIVRKIYTSAKGAPEVYWAKFAYSTDPAWITYIRGGLPRPDGQQGDTILVRFSAPPNPQRVVVIQRQVNFTMGQAPNGGVVIASLRQKYGMNTKKALGASGVAWLMDEQGSPLPATYGMVCSGLTQQSSVGGSQQSPGTVPFLLSPNPFTDFDVVRLSRMCKYPINISTLLDENQTQNPLGSLSITMTENGIDDRAAIATQKYIDKLNAAQRQRQIDQGNHQAVPKL
jgi:hypothetical protein